jgi:negative regulator of genetic competence ClpC/MecB
LKRAIQNHIEDGLSELILSGEIKAGDTIKISKEKDNDKLKFDILPTE